MSDICQQPELMTRLSIEDLKGILFEGYSKRGSSLFQALIVTQLWRSNRKMAVNCRVRRFSNLALSHRTESVRQMGQSFDNAPGDSPEQIG